MKYTELSKKEQGRQRYERHYGRVGARLARSRRTHASDIAPARITDGQPLVLTKQVFSHTAAKLSWMDLLLAKLKHDKKDSDEMTFEAVGPFEVQPSK